jgi:hypothetical protein
VLAIRCTQPCTFAFLSCCPTGLAAYVAISYMKPITLTLRRTKEDRLAAIGCLVEGFATYLSP